MIDDRLPGKPIELPRLALSLASLALAGFSLVLLGQMLWLSAASRSDFAAHNVLGVPQRQVLLLAIAAGLAVPIFATLLVLWFRRRRSGMLSALHRVATLCGPLGVVFAVPGLFLATVAQAKPLFYLTVLLGFGVAFSLLLTRAFDARAQRRSSILWQRLRSRAMVRAVPLALLLIFAAGYVLVLGRSAVVHHRLIQTVAEDVGITDNVMSNLLHGNFFRAPARFGTDPGSYLSLHAEYASLLFLPIYRLRPGAEGLLWLQVVLAALAVLPLYLLVAARLGQKMAFWFGAMYLLLAPVHGALLNGFSWLPAVTLFSLTLYYAVESERRWLMYPSLLLLLSVSEAGPLNVFAFGLFLLVVGKRTRLGLGLTALSAAVIALNLLRSARGLGAVEQPALAGAMAALLKNPVYFVLDLARAVKLTSALHALAPLCLLPLFELATWPLFIPALLFTSAANEYWPSHVVYPSSLIWIPACLLGLLYTLREQQADAKKRSRYLAWVVTLSVLQLSHSYDFGALLRTDSFGDQSPAETFRMTSQGQRRYDQLMQLVRRIPASASVATTTYLLSHVSNRVDAFDLSRPYGQPDYILLSTRELSALRPSLDATFAERHYRFVAAAGDEFYLFSRGAETAQTRSAFKKLGLRAP
jgi:uncharacterized membrane protein